MLEGVLNDLLGTTGTELKLEHWGRLPLAEKRKSSLLDKNLERRLLVKK